MRIPVIKGTIKRRLLVNFRADPGVVQRLLPAPFRPKLQRGYAVVGICLIRLERIRPAGLPEAVGISSENAAHRIAVEWAESGAQREGVFIPRRDTSAWLNRIAGGRVFPGEHHAARFSVRDRNGHLELAMESRDGLVSVKVVGDECAALPAASCFESLLEASAFFEGGSLGYSAKPVARASRPELPGKMLKPRSEAPPPWDLRLFYPGGMREISPAFQRWVGGREPPSPAGTTEPVVFHSPLRDSFSEPPVPGPATARPGHFWKSLRADSTGRLVKSCWPWTRMPALRNRHIPRDIPARLRHPRFP